MGAWAQRLCRNRPGRAWTVKDRAGDPGPCGLGRPSVTKVPMQPMIALLMQAAAALGPAPDRRPPAPDHGWVFPTSQTKAATADCPVTGRTSAEFRFSPAEGTKIVAVSGLGRVASPADLRKIDGMLGPMQGMLDVSVGCWGEIAAWVRVRGLYDVDGQPRHDDVMFLWRPDGPVLLRDTAIYPSRSG